MHADAAIEIGICRLLVRQLDITPNRTATDFFGAAVRRFHDARAATGHNRESKARDSCAHFPGEIVIRVVARNPRRAEHGYARTNKMECAKSAQEIAHDSQHSEKFSKTGPRSFQENFVGAFGTYC